MSKFPLVSVALATYNGEEFLRDQIESIYAQTYKNIEVIVCDDSSTDSTTKILDEYVASHGLKYYLNKNNIGFMRNFEKTISLCSGDYVALSDQDDVWLPNKISVLVDNIGDNDLVCSNAILIDKKGDVLKGRWRTGDICFNSRDTFEFLLYRNFVTGCTSMIKKNLIKEAFPIPNNEKYHDWWLAIFAAQRNGIVYLKQPLISYRQHERQDTGAGRVSKISMFISVFNKYFGKNEENVKFSQMQKNRIMGLLKKVSKAGNVKMMNEALIYFDDMGSNKRIHLRALWISIKKYRLLYKVI